MLILSETNNFSIVHFGFLNEVYLCYTQNTAKESQVLPLFFHEAEIFGNHNHVSTRRMRPQPEWIGSCDIEFRFHS